MTWLYNGRRINEQSAWTDDNGTQHPANWGLWSEEEKAAILAREKALAEPGSEG